MSRTLPSDIRFYPGPRLMVYRPRGILSERRIDALIKCLEQEENKISEPFNRYTDLSKLEALELDIQTMIRISLHRRVTYAGKPPAKSAFYVTNPAVARVVQVHVLLTEESSLQVRMFEKVNDAAKWLRVSRELLDAPGKSPDLETA